MEKKPVVILFTAFYEPWVSGAERFAVEAVAGQKDRYRFVVLTSRLSRSVPAREERDGYEIVRLGFGFSLDKYFFPVLAAFAARRYPASLAHAVMESYAGVALWIYEILRPRVPRILTLQSGDLDTAEKQKRIPERLWRRIHASPDHVTAISGFLATRAAYLRGSGHEISVIPNGVDLANIPAAHDPVPGRIVCVARLSWEKGHHYLIEALSELRKKRPEAHLVLIGDGSLREDMEKEVRWRGLEGAVTFRGTLTNREALLEVARAEAFACPSLAEGLGIVFLEAQAVGVPVIGTNVGGIPDVIEDGVTGLLVPPKDSAALAAALERVLADRSFAARLVQTAKERIPRFSWKRITEELGSLYERLRNQKRILIATGIYPPDIGGPATYVRFLADALAKADWRVTIVTYGDDTTEPVSFPTTLHVVSRRLPLLVRHFIYFLRVRRLGKSVDMIFAQDPFSAGLPAALANVALRKRFAIKIVGDYAWEQGQARFGVRDLLDDFQKRRYGPLVEFFRAVQVAVTTSADQVITPSAYLKNIVSGWGVPENQIEVIPNAVVATFSHDVPSEEEFRARPPVITTAGRFLPWKGIGELIELMPRIREAVPAARLEIIGDGPLRTLFEGYVARLGLTDAVSFLGRLSHRDALDRIAQSRVFVLYSAYEGFSHQLVEALAAGVPVVASSAGGNPEVAKDGENALVVPYGDQTALWEAIALLLKDPTLSVRLAGKGREVAGQYTPERMIGSLTSLLERLCKRS